MDRLHKVLAHAGVASRRRAEQWIREGRVAINGEVVRELGVKVDPSRDRIEVDGKRIGRAEKKVYLLLHKPRGVVTTAEDDLGRRTVLDLLPPMTERVYPVGRLDRDSEGLLLLTNDGELAYHLTHPSRGVRRTYLVTIDGEIEPAMLANLVAKGLYLGPAKIQPLAAEVVRHLEGRTVVEITVAEGVNREIRRLFAALGREVRRLVRVKFGPLVLKGLGEGRCRLLTEAEVGTLRRGMRAAEERPVSAPPRRARRVREVLHGKPDPARSRLPFQPRSGREEDRIEPLKPLPIPPVPPVRPEPVRAPEPRQERRPDRRPERSGDRKAGRGFEGRRDWKRPHDPERKPQRREENRADGRPEHRSERPFGRKFGRGFEGKREWKKPHDPERKPQRREENRDRPGGRPEQRPERKFEGRREGKPGRGPMRPARPGPKRGRPAPFVPGPDHPLSRDR